MFTQEDLECVGETHCQWATGGAVSNDHVVVIVLRGEDLERNFDRHIKEQRKRRRKLRLNGEDKTVITLTRRYLWSGIRNDGTQEDEKHTLLWIKATRFRH